MKKHKSRNPVTPQPTNPITPRERWLLEQVWSQCLREARRGTTMVEPYPPWKPGPISQRAQQNPRTAPVPNPSAQRYWELYRKCAACPGPHRRHGKLPFGTWPNRGKARLPPNKRSRGAPFDTETGEIHDR